MKFRLVEEQNIEYDSEGNALTPEQSEFFRNSKVRDEQGRLLVCYHGDAENRALKGSYYAANGMWFTTSKTTADVYAEYNLRTSYLNMVHPFVMDCNYKAGRETPNIVDSKLFKIVNWDKVVYWFNLYDTQPINLLNTSILVKNYNFNEFKKLLCSYIDLKYNYINIDFNDYIQIELTDKLLHAAPNADKWIDIPAKINEDNIIEITNDTFFKCLTTLSTVIYYGVGYTETGGIVSAIYYDYRKQYDGVILKNIAVGDDINDRGDVFVIFMARQEKLITNTNPTNSNNINESLRVITNKDLLDKYKCDKIYEDDDNIYIFYDKKYVGKDMTDNRMQNADDLLTLKKIKYQVKRTDKGVRYIIPKRQ